MTISALALPEPTARRLIVVLGVAFIVLDVAALALLGPISPTDTPDDVARLYDDRATLVLISRLIHCLGLSVALAFLGLVVGRLRALEGGAGTLSRIFYGGLVALVPIEVVRNVLFAALALRYDDFDTVALPLHVFAVLLGPAIAVPVTAAAGALAVLLRSWLISAVAFLWAISMLRLVTLNTVIWYGGLTAFVGLLVVVVMLVVKLGRPQETLTTMEPAT